jgi:hypothetical protein
MTNGELINEIGALMEEDKMSVAAYRRLMLKATKGVLVKQDSMDTMLVSVCKDVEVNGEDIKTLKKRDNINNAVTAVVAAFAAIVGFDK